MLAKHVYSVLEISAAAAHTDANKVLSRTCHFVNLQWITTKENCLDKIYFRLSSKAGGRDLEFCPQCKINLGLSVVYREFNCLDKSYVLAKNT